MDLEFKLQSYLIDQLSQLLGSNSVSTSDGHEIDGLTPQAVVRPADLLQLSEIMRWAASKQVSLLPRGGGTRSSLGNIPLKTDVVLDMGAFDHVLDYQPADMTATVEAGMTLSSMQRQLALGGEFVPLESAQSDRSTIGGILSVGAGGPLSHTYGLPREWLIGISVMTTKGIVTKAGGKVVKNVTGYDLNKLYTGALGTLGVIVEASFKLLPREPHSGALVVSFPTVEASIAAGKKLLHTPAAPLGYHCVSSGVTNWLKHFSQPVSQELGLENREAPLCFSYFAGRAQATKRRMDEATAVLLSEGGNATYRIEGNAADEMLKWLTDTASIIKTSSTLVMKISVQPQLASSVSKECADITVLGQIPDQVVDPGFGSIRFFWSEPGNDSTQASDVDQSVLDAIQKIRAIIHRYKGSAVVENCPVGVKRQIDIWGHPPDSLELMQSIKKRFDPDCILNPGRFLGGI